MLSAIPLAFHLIALPVLMILLSGCCDILDGALARYLKQVTPLGAVIDIVMDRCVEFAVIFGLWLIQPELRAGLCLFMLGSILLCVTSFLVVGIFTPNQSTKSFHYSVGIIERPEAFIFFILMIIFPLFFTLLAIMFSLLVLLTTALRIVEFSQHQSREQRV
ncbi:MAG: CDP-alcohol phosphatidyltransferase family protein [Gammaproteobacteria bacterium]|nr:CDP-alcohol phosphatidyltransferase family protein [Gammaproteobacteria bacterium]